MDKVEYPKYLYAAGGESRVVASAAEHQAAGEGWYESPGEAQAAEAGEADADKPKGKPKGKPKTDEQ